MTDSSLVLLSKLSRSFFVESEHVYIATLRRILQFMHFLELEKVDRTAQDSFMEILETVISRYCQELFPHIDPYQLQNTDAIPNSCLATFILLRAVEAQIVTKCSDYEMQLRMISLNRSFSEIECIASVLSRHSLRLEPGSLSLPIGDFCTTAKRLLDEVNDRNACGQTAPLHPDFYAFVGLLPSATWSTEHEFFRANSPALTPALHGPSPEVYAPELSYPSDYSPGLFAEPTSFAKYLAQNSLIIRSPTLSLKSDWHLTQEDINTFFKDSTELNMPMEVDEGAVKQLVEALFPTDQSVESTNRSLRTTPSTSGSTLSDMDISNSSSSLSDMDISISPSHSFSSLRKTSRISVSGSDSLSDTKMSSISPDRSPENGTSLSTSVSAPHKSSLSTMSSSSSMDRNFPSIAKTSKPRSVSGPGPRRSPFIDPNYSFSPDRSIPSIAKISKPRRASGPGLYGSKLSDCDISISPDHSFPSLRKTLPPHRPSGSSPHHPKNRVSSLSAVPPAAMNVDAENEISDEEVEEETEIEPVMENKENEKKAGV